MILSIAIEEHAELKKWVGTVLDTWNHAARREGGLLNITVVVLGVLVENQFTVSRTILVSYSETQVTIFIGVKALTLASVHVSVSRFPVVGHK